MNIKSKSFNQVKTKAISIYHTYSIITYSKKIYTINNLQSAYLKSILSWNLTQFAV